MTGHSVHIGLDVVSGFRYGARLRPLERACRDAAELARVSKRRGFSALTLHDERATGANVRAVIGDAARTLRRNDTFVLTFSGHGISVQTLAGFQQSWCLFDNALVRFGPDGLDAQLAKFRAGVRILIVANCCFAAANGTSSLPTPPIRAHVVRLASCRTNEPAFDTSDEDGPSPFVVSLKAALRARAEPGFFPFYDRLNGNRHPAMRPHLEIGHPRSESFLATGPFRLP